MSGPTPPPGTSGGYAAPPGTTARHAAPPGTTGEPAHSPDAAPPPGAQPAPDPGSTSVGELIGQVTRDLSTLIRQELALAQAELRQEATKTGKAAGALSAAGAAAFLVALFLSIALWSALSNVMDAGWAGLIVAVLWAIIAAVLYTTGRAKLREVRPKPERTVDTLSSVPDALRGQRGGTQ
jgi:hypothetical protein